MAKSKKIKITIDSMDPALNDLIERAVDSEGGPKNATKLAIYAIEACLPDPSEPFAKENISIQNNSELFVEFSVKVPEIVGAGVLEVRDQRRALDKRPWGKGAILEESIRKYLFLFGPQLELSSVEATGYNSLNRSHIRDVKPGETPTQTYPSELRRYMEIFVRNGFDGIKSEERLVEKAILENPDEPSPKTALLNYIDKHRHELGT